MNKKIKKMVFLALFIALGVLLMLWEFPLLPAAPWLKIDFSFIPVLLVALVYGKREAILVAVIINVLNYLLNPQAAILPIGEIANLLALLTYLLIFTYWQTRGKLIVGCLSATLAVTGVMLLANYFWITPWFFALYGLALPENFFIYCVEVYGLFNLLRWSIIGILTYMLDNGLKVFVKHVRNSIQNY